MSQCEEGHCLIAEAKGADHRCDHKCAYADRDTCNHGECFGGKCIYEGATMTKQSDTPRTDENENKQFCRECGGRIDAEFARQLERELTALRAENEGLREKLEAAEAKYEACKLEAQIHAQEARTANSTIAEIYQEVTGSTGEPGNWNGARPVIEKLETAERELDALRIANNDLQDHFDAMAIERKAAVAAMAVFQGRILRRALNAVARECGHDEARTVRILDSLKLKETPSIEEGERIVRDAERQVELLRECQKTLEQCRYSEQPLAKKVEAYLKAINAQRGER